jgi:hypothetical protein
MDGAASFPAVRTVLWMLLYAMNVASADATETRAQAINDAIMRRGVVRNSPAVPWAAVPVAFDTVLITTLQPFLAMAELQPRPHPNDELIPSSHWRREPWLQRDSVQGASVRRTKLQGREAAIWLSQELQLSM